MYAPVGITAGTSSFSTTPADHLDPELFDGEHLKPSVRNMLLSEISGFLSSRYTGVNQWLKVWLAGSGASYRWQGSGNDLDVLLGIDFVSFRRSNQKFTGLGDVEISRYLNDEMRHELWPTTANWLGKYEVTWFVNPRSQDIKTINPYSAYDIIRDGWEVPPSRTAPTIPQEWPVHASRYEDHARGVLQHYSNSLTEMQNARNPIHRRDAEVRFRHSVDAAVSLYDSVHNSRRTAFSPTGEGFADFSNYLWQHGKANGWIPALREVKQYHEQEIARNQQTTYGMELPDPDVLVARAMMMNL